MFASCGYVLTGMSDYIARLVDHNMPFVREICDCWEYHDKEDCCDLAYGPQGNSACWNHRYTYDICCKGLWKQREDNLASKYVALAYQ